MHWWLSVIDADTWKNDVSRIFSETREERILREEAEAKWGTPDEDGRGEFKVERAVEVESASTLSITPARS